MMQTSLSQALHGQPYVDAADRGWYRRRLSFTLRSLIPVLHLPLRIHTDLLRTFATMSEKKVRDATPRAYTCGVLAAGYTDMLR